MINARKLTAPAPKAAPEPIHIVFEDADIPQNATFKHYPISERYLAVSIQINKEILRFYFFDLIEKRKQYQCEAQFDAISASEKECFLFAQGLFNDRFIIIGHHGTIIIVNIKESTHTKNTFLNFPNRYTALTPISLHPAIYIKDDELLLTTKDQGHPVALNLNLNNINESKVINFPENTATYRHDLDIIKNPKNTLIKTCRYENEAKHQDPIWAIEEYNFDAQTNVIKLDKTRVIPGIICHADSFGPYIAVTARKNETYYLGCLNTETNQCITASTPHYGRDFEWLNNGMLLFKNPNKNDALFLFDPSTNEVTPINDRDKLKPSFKITSIANPQKTWLLEITPPVIDYSSPLLEETKDTIHDALNVDLPIHELKGVVTSYLRRYDFFSSTAPLPPDFHKMFLAPYRLPKELQVKMLELYDTLDAKDVAQKQKKDALEEITTLINQGQNPAAACDTVCKKYPLADKRFSTSLFWANRMEGGPMYDLLQEIRQVRIDATPALQPDAKKLQ